MKKLFKSISLITLTLILTLGLFGCGKKSISNFNSNINQNQNVNVATSTTATSTSENLIEEMNIENIDISNWKTYRNEEYGFEFKYPEDWDLKVGYKNLPILTKSNCSLKDKYDYYSCIISEVNFELYNFDKWSNDYAINNKNKDIFFIKKSDKIILFTNFNVFLQDFVANRNFYSEVNNKLIKIKWYPSEASNNDYPLIYLASKNEFSKFKIFLLTIDGF